MPLLELNAVAKSYGALKVTDDITLAVEAGQTLGILGPNGAGKTTLFNLISGVYKPEPGASIVFDGDDITGWEPHEIARHGIGRTFQNIRICGEMSVMDNVLMAAHHRGTTGLLSAIFRTKKYNEDESAIRKKADELLDVFGLTELKNEEAGSLPYGSQRRLDMQGSADPRRCGDSYRLVRSGMAGAPDGRGVQGGLCWGHHAPTRPVLHLPRGADQVPHDDGAPRVRAGGAEARGIPARAGAAQRDGAGARLHMVR